MPTNTDLQRKKLLSQKKHFLKRSECVLKITKNDWNPFERADPSVLEKVMRESIKKRINNLEDALL